MPHIKNALIRYRIIDRCIRNKYRPYPTKQDLREACEEALYGSVDGANICDSTIEKDMFAMKMEHDAPIKYSKRNGGYYYQDPEFSINDIPLTEEDLSAIKFAANTLMQFRDADMFRQFGNAIDKIVDRVSISSNPNDKDLNHFVQFESAVSSGGNEYLPGILDAIRNNLIITFDYTSFVSGKTKKRVVFPLLLKEYRNRWYLISYDRSKEGIITYALDRMADLIVTEESGSRPSDFNADNYFKYAVGITADNESEPESIIFKADNVAAKYIESQPFHTSQRVLKSGKNRTTFEMKVLVSEELIRSFLSYGGEIEILSSLPLRENIIKRLRAMNDIYGH
ncbi:MAG: helix-turn-helix transcriptional regulator [Flavobacteriia bacterium]|jgi:predicted DNA-binding transcriptional regulator YafY